MRRLPALPVPPAYPDVRARAMHVVTRSPFAVARIRSVLYDESDWVCGCGRFDGCDLEFLCPLDTPTRAREDIREWGADGHFGVAYVERLTVDQVYWVTRYLCPLRVRCPLPLEGFLVPEPLVQIEVERRAPTTFGMLGFCGALWVQRPQRGPTVCEGYSLRGTPPAFCTSTGRGWRVRACPLCGGTHTHDAGEVPETMTVPAPCGIAPRYELKPERPDRDARSHADAQEATEEPAE